MSNADSASRTLAGIGWMVLTTLLFVCVTGIVRYLGSDIPATQAAFLRYLIGCFLVLPALMPLFKRKLDSLPWGLFAARGLVHGIAVWLWFYAMARVPIAEVTAIGYTAPIFVTIGAWLFLGETLHARRIAAVVIGLLGVLIILRPGFETVQIGALAQLLAAPLFACSFLLAKRLTKLERPSTIVALLSVFCTLALLPGALAEWRDPTWEEVAWLGLTAVFATAGHYTLTRAFEAAPLTVTQPLGFLQLIWATILGIVAFGEPLDPWVILGGGIVVAAVTFISHREMLAAKRARTPVGLETKV
ncbi:MAG: DMT family transporter [Pseudomonadota bacterium]